MTESLADAKRQVRERIADGEGVMCPCCGSWNKAYRRRLNRAKVRELQAMYRWADENDSLFDFFHVPSTGMSLRNREYPKLRWWQLIEPRDPEVGSGENTGFWKLTLIGVKFVRGEVRLPNMVVEYRSEFLRFADDAELVGVREALLDDSIDPDE